MNSDDTGTLSLELDIPQPRTAGHETYALRDYQTDAITAVEKAWTAGLRRVGIVLPTGAGKTITFAHIIRRAERRTLVLAHRDELIGQAAEKIAAICPSRRVGIVKAGHDDHRADIVVASVQTLARPERRQRIGPVGLVVVDEAHHAVAATYRDTLTHFGCFTPDGPVALGVTATMARTDDTEALGDIWERVVHQLDILDLIDAGHLADVRGVSVALPGLNLDSVRSTGGDYQAGQLAEQMDIADAWTAAADAYLAHAADRRGIVFTPTVDAAHQTAEMLAARGITAEAVDGTTPVDERRGILARFASGTTQVVTNCGVLTEGYDAPWCSAVLIARPTKSDVLYVQMAGRGLRTHPGKTDALVIDLVGVARRKTLATLACLTGRDVGEMPEGASLAEARQQHLTESKTVTPYLGELDAADIDLFDRADGTVWPDWHGVRFVDVSKHKAIVYIAPNPGLPERYDVIGRDRVQRQEHILAQGDTFRAALGHAEKWAAERGSHLVRRKAQWRGRPASESQLAVLERMGIPVPTGCTGGHASHLITTQVIDREFTRWPPRGYTAANQAIS